MAARLQPSAHFPPLPPTSYPTSRPHLILHLPLHFGQPQDALQLLQERRGTAAPAATTPRDWHRRRHSSSSIASQSKTSGSGGASSSSPAAADAAEHLLGDGLNLRVVVQAHGSLEGGIHVGGHVVYTTHVGHMVDTPHV